MARQVINASDTLPASRPKINENFEELYGRRLVRDGWDFENPATRDAATLTDDDLGFVCRVESPLGYFLLRQRTPTVVWEQLGGGSGGAAIGRGAWSARPSTPAVGDYYLVTDAPMTELRCWSAGVWTTYCNDVEVAPLATAGLTNWNVSSEVIADVGPYASITNRATDGTGDRYSALLATLSLTSNYVLEIGVICSHWAGPILAGSSGNGGIVPARGQSATPTSGNVVFRTLNSSGEQTGNQFASAVMEPVPVYWRIVDDGTNRDWFISPDRVTWVRVLRTTRTDHITAARAGITVSDARNVVPGSSMATRCVLVHFSQVAL